MNPRIVLITGASSGLGLSLAENFLQRGDIVYGVTQTKRNWPGARKRLNESSSRFLLYQGDVSREPQVKKLISKIAKAKGRIDILINNAGYANRPIQTERESLKELQKNISHNLISTFLMTKYALPLFKKQKSGWIINVSSMAGKRAVPHLTAYSATKFGVVAISQSVAKENPDGGFKCITVCPGGMNTTLRSKLFGKADAEKQQSPDFVAAKILDVIDGTLDVPSGGDIVIRHGQVTAINSAPEN